MIYGKVTKFETLEDGSAKIVIRIEQNRTADISEAVTLNKKDVVIREAGPEQAATPIDEQHMQEILRAIERYGRQQYEYGRGSRSEGSLLMGADIIS